MEEPKKEPDDGEFGEMIIELARGRYEAKPVGTWHVGSLYAGLSALDSVDDCDLGLRPGWHVPGGLP